MAVKKRSRSSVWSVLRFVVRFLGLNGLVAAAVGAVIWFALDDEETGRIVVLAGGAAVALALLVELPGLLFAAASHRGVAGFNVVLQVACAAAMLAGANYFSFSHHLRFDCTRDQTFTLDPKVRDKLTHLRGETDIVVYLQHVSFGQRVDLRQDQFDQAAEKVITEKIKDLVDQFGEIGPRIRIHVLDTQKKTYKDREKALSATSKELVAAIKNAPENSVFFFSHDTKQIQRLSFNDIYHLDRKASTDANGNPRNLVLIDQGVRNFAHKVLRIEEKKPRVGFAVVHGWLGQEGAEEYGMPALKKTLASHGYEGRDIVLKKNLREPAALEHDESRYEILEAQKNRLERGIKEFEDVLKETDKTRDFWNTKSLDEVNKEYVIVLTLRGYMIRTHQWVDAFREKNGREPSTRRISKDFQIDAVKELTKKAGFFESEIASMRKRLAKTKDEQSTLPEERLAENRRITDVKAKFNRLLSDIDLLVVPRYTAVNLLRDEMINPRVHGLDDSHVEAIKEFIKAGKPVLFCLGPVSSRGEDPAGADRNGDSIEKLLARFNVVLPNQTILFNSEADAMAEIEDRELLQNGGLVEIPPAEFTWKTKDGTAPFGRVEAKSRSPIRTSLHLTDHGLGENSRTGLRIRYPRPVYLMPMLWTPQAIGGTIGALAFPAPMASTQAVAALMNQTDREFDEKAVFLMTSPDCWNEDRPFILEDWTPHYVRPESDDPDKGTVKEKRQGPFPIGVAFEADVPADWYGSDGSRKPTHVRLAVIGDGAIFLGDKLSPVREKLFLDVSNWLLGRENLLAQESTPWEYPRVQLSPGTKDLWEWGTRYALPLFFVFLGVNVWLVRRMR